MAYYSTVAVTMRMEDYDSMYAELAGFPRDDSRWIMFQQSMERVIDEEGGAIVISWDGIKWNENFEDVGYFMDKFRSIPCIFQRLGESIGDYEHTEYNLDEDSEYLWDYEPYVVQEFDYRDI